MEGLSLAVGVWGLFIYFCELPSLVERKRVIEGKTEFLKDMIEDFKGAQQRKKRKLDDCGWVHKGNELVKVSKRLLGQGEEWKRFLMCAKVCWDLYNLGVAINAHSNTGDMLLRRVSSDVGDLCPGYPLPVNRLVGEIALRTLSRVKSLLEGEEVGKIVIHGIQGVGKTCMMKHLHNYAISLFDYVFWVSSPVDSSVMSMQDAIAVVVKCDFDSDDDSFIRASKLLDKLGNLGKFALFVDGITNVNFSAEEVGIPVSASHSLCKLVQATNAILGGSMFSSFEKIEIERLSREDAYELFMREADIREESVPALGDVPGSFTEACGGVPQVIINLATCICNIDDPHEWRCAQLN